MNSDTGSNISGSQVKPGRLAYAPGAAIPAGTARSDPSMWRLRGVDALLQRSQQGAVRLVRAVDCARSSGVASDIERSKRSCSISFA